MPAEREGNPPSRHQLACLSQLSQSFCVSPVELTDARGAGRYGRGSNSYDREKAWPSSNHSLLSAPHRQQKDYERRRETVSIAYRANSSDNNNSVIFFIIHGPFSLLPGSVSPIPSSHENQEVTIHNTGCVMAQPWSAIHHLNNGLLFSFYLR